MSESVVNAVPAPWNLRGKGYMFLYNFPKNWAQKTNFMPVEQSGDYQGGLGALMLVDYEASNVGPYRELLLIPGKFSWGQHHCYSISRIWVSSMISVVSGRKNWGIPKNQAEFSVHSSAPRHETWELTVPGAEPFFKAELSYGRLPMPIHTAFLPFPLLQTWEGQRYKTRFSGYGLGHFAQLNHLEFDNLIFPDISAKKPLLGFRIDPFYIKFPLPDLLAL
ncbi:MAG: acetoacetate decarboxylase family protein [Proteobacteria bacterium]|nr:acetoacetate decarboxylase family protein [Pseudomonadota bacterium]